MNPTEFRHRRVRTPVELINLANLGGLSFGSLVEVYGGTKSGKSTFCYQTAEYFLEDYGDQARVLILDAEGAVNFDRLLFAFHLDVEGDPRISRRPAMTIEMANDEIIRASHDAKANGYHLLVIWDSIKVSSFKNAKKAMDAAFEKRENGGDEEEIAVRGMTEPMARAQVLGWCLNNALHEVYDAPIVILLINQITTKVNQFNTSLDSSGGFTLRHNVNERIKFDFVKNIGGDKKDDVFKTGTMSSVTIMKSRNMPSLQNISVVIDDTVGGRIQSEQEIPLVASKLGVLVAKSGGWYSVAPECIPADATKEELELYTKSRQYRDIATSPQYLELLKKAIVKSLRDSFKMIDFQYSRQEARAVQPEKEEGKTVKKTK